MTDSSTGEERTVYEKVLARRDELTRELRDGQEMLAELDAKRAELQQTLLRISGAVQVLTELVDGNGTGAGSDPAGRIAGDPPGDGQAPGGTRNAGAADLDGSLNAVGPAARPLP